MSHEQQKSAAGFRHLTDSKDFTYNVVFEPLEDPVLLQKGEKVSSLVEELYYDIKSSPEEAPPNHHPQNQKPPTASS